MKKIFIVLCVLIMSSLANGQTVDKQVNCLSAGTLHSYFTEAEMGTLTDLTVTGTINAKDIGSISRIYSLLNLDLSGSTIVSFTGYPYPIIEGNPENYPQQVFPANYFPEGMFQYSSLRSIVFPNTLKVIGNHAFFNSMLQSMVLPEGLVSIRYNAFQNCESLALGLTETLTFPSTLDSVGENAFANCTALTGVINVPYKHVGYNAFGNSGFRKAVFTNDTVHAGCFKDCKKLYEVSLYNYNTKIVKDRAFEGCTKLALVNFPMVLQSIGKRAFANTALTGQLYFRDELTEIADSAFINNSKFTSIHFSKNLRKIGQRAFEGSIALNQDLILPDSLHQIGYYGFAGCTKITSVVFPSKLANISEGSFYNCSDIKKIHFSDKTWIINQNAFNGCTAVDSIFLPNPSVPLISGSTFDSSLYPKTVLLVPNVNTYKAAQVWVNFIKIISTTTLQDTQAPILSSSYPANNDINVSQTPSVSLKFDEKVMLKANANFVVKIVEQGQNTAKFSYNYLSRVNTDSTIVYFEPLLDTYFDSNPDTLKRNTFYTLVIPAGMIMDKSGNVYSPTANVEFTFKTGSKNAFHSMFYPVGDMKQINSQFLGGSTGNACGAVSNRYHIQNAFYKRDFVENGVNLSLFSRSSICYYELSSTVPTYNGSKSYLDLSYFLNNGVVEAATDKAIIMLDKFNNSVYPVSDLFFKLNVNIDASIKLYSNGIVNNSLAVYPTITNNGLTYNYIHLPILNAAVIDSVVIEGRNTSVSGVFIQYKPTAKPVVNLGQDRLFCDKDLLMLDAGFNPGATYLWNTNEKSQKINVSTSGAFSVQVTNDLGTTTDEINVTAVTKPDPLNNKKTIVKCAGDNVTLTADDNANFTYEWRASHNPLFSSTEKSIMVVTPGMYSVKMNNGGCELIDTVYVEDRQGARVAFINQSCCFGYSDLQAELYTKNQQGNYSIFKIAAAPGGGGFFDSIPTGEYIYKSHVNQLTMLTDNNPWVDTYHNGKTDWTKVTPFKLNCTTDTTIAFTMAKMDVDFNFNGTGIISGNIGTVNPQLNVAYKKIKAQSVDECETKILLYDGSDNIIATTCPDANGNYSFTNLPAGSYSIGLERTGFVVQNLFSTVLPTGGSISNVNFTVDEHSLTIIHGLPTALAPIVNSNALNVSVTPNPVKTKANLLILSDINCKATISILDVTGRVCKSLDRNLLQGENAIKLNNEGFLGVYLLKVSTINNTKVIRVVFE